MTVSSLANRAGDRHAERDAWVDGGRDRGGPTSAGEAGHDDVPEGTQSRGGQAHLMLGDRILTRSEVIRAILSEDGWSMLWGPALVAEGLGVVHRQHDRLKEVAHRFVAHLLELVEP